MYSFFLLSAPMCVHVNRSTRGNVLMFFFLLLWRTYVMYVFLSEWIYINCQNFIFYSKFRKWVMCAIAAAQTIRTVSQQSINKILIILLRLLIHNSACCGRLRKPATSTFVIYLFIVIFNLCFILFLLFSWSILEKLINIIYFLSNTMYIKLRRIATVELGIILLYSNFGNLFVGI